MEDAHRRLEAAVKRRNELDAEVQRMRGKLESAQQSLAVVEKECRARKIEPDQLDKAIEGLHKKYLKAVADIEEKVTTAENALQPYLNETPGGPA